MQDKGDELSVLKKFISFPSVSSKPEYDKYTRACAIWVADYLTNCGLTNVQLIKTKKHPVVFAQRIENPNYPTILFYGHYDVQPEDPIEEWQTNPFSGTVKENFIYGRGASDDKGQLLTHVLAVKQLLNKSTDLGVNIKFLIEGEEEIGSPNLEDVLHHYSHLINADVAVVSDMKMISATQPALTYALRGSVNFELTVLGQPKELHSGTFGGAVYNPLQALAEMISKIHNKEMMVNIPGFYDNIEFEPTDLNALHFISDRQILNDASAKRGWGSSRFSLYDKTTALPAFNLCGLIGGYNKEGVKSIIPSHATAKFNVRIVPGQHPDDIAQKISEFFHAICPPHFHIKIKLIMKVPAIKQSLSNPFIRMAARAYHHGFGNSPAFIKSGGTIPVVSLLQKKLNIPVLMMGFALGNDDMHAADEKFYLPNFFNGIKTIKSLIKQVSHLTKKYNHATTHY